ncbi:MAG: opacity family porin [Filomicrobium sp.]
MKLKVLSLSLGLAVLTAIGTSANAADWNYGAGSIKDYSSAAVPVPAPVPVPEYAARYYFRADAGVGFGDAPDSSETGMVYGQDAEYGSFGMHPSWFHDDFDTFVTLGVGVGMNFGRGFRADLTAETRSQGKVKINGEYNYATRERGGAWEEVYGFVDDETSLRGGVFLLNGYYDLAHFKTSRFTPYIGAGIGFAWNELKRNHNTREVSRGCSSGGCTSYGARSSRNVQDKTHDISFAAAAMAGVSYRLSDYALLDMNYRYLFIDATDVGFAVNGPTGTYGGNTKVSIGETHEHQLRAGIRFEVN